MENYFFDSYNNQMYLPLENVVLVIGVDTDLTAKTICMMPRWSM